MDLQRFIEPYSPWISPKTADAWHRMETQIPTFRRPIFQRLKEDLDSIGQIISVTGPRRVGKTTVLRQLIHYLLDGRNVDPSQVIYYSFDDPALFRRGYTGGDVLEGLMDHACQLKPDGTVYLFLDEIQTLQRWEQYLKKYYDLKYPVRVVISGSASSPIFKKTRESLLGRVKDYHLLPFSFREFLLYQTQDSKELQQEIETLSDVGARMRGMFAKDPADIDIRTIGVPEMTDGLWTRAQEALNTYLIDGGFPEVWEFETAEKKIEYLFDNQVNKVISEDLVLAAEFRKPEQLKIFYVSLLEQPGREVNLTKLSQEIGVSVQQIDKYLPLLEMTDLIAHAGKFRTSAVRVRQGNRKYYLVDLALRNAVLRIGQELLEDSTVLGLYAENLVFNALRKWEGVLQIDYYRNGRNEVDFVVHTRPARYFLVEVKYRKAIPADASRGIRHFQNKYTCHGAIVVTKHKKDFGWRENGVFYLPLLHFLLLFD